VALAALLARSTSSDQEELLWLAEGPVRIRDVVGGRAGGYERALSGARDAALEDMISAARELGADGIVGIDFDYEVLGENNGMMMVSVSGTAVKMA
jgi:uncharacterized protein YbjQ (UPF0145 family)